MPTEGFCWFVCVCVFYFLWYVCGCAFLSFFFFFLLQKTFLELQAISTINCMAKIFGGWNLWMVRAPQKSLSLLSPFLSKMIE